MKGRITSGLLISSLALVASCGGSGTSSSGTFSCNGGSVQLGPGLTCDDSTSPPTIKINYGTTTGTVAAGDDSRFTGGKYLGTFIPSVAQANPPQVSAPGGLMSGHNGGLIYNGATGRIGVRAANEICSSIADWPSHPSGPLPNAHACTNEELIANAHAGAIPQGTTGMAFGIIPHNYASADSVPINSFKGTCADWTYDSQDRDEGTTWTVDVSDPKTIVSGSFDKAPSIEFVVGQSCGGAAGSGIKYAIACCD